MKKSFLYRVTVLAVFLAIYTGCETGNIKQKSTSQASGDSSMQTAKSDGKAFSDYIFSHKKAKLNATDCLMFSGQDWDRLYGDLIYVIAPADAMARSVDACRGVMYGVEYGYSLQRMSRGPIEYGFLNDDLKDISYTSYPLYRYISQAEREESSIDQINQMTLAQCQQKFGQFETKNEITMEMIDAMAKQSEAKSQKEIDELSLYIAQLSHCDDLMFGE